MTYTIFLSFISYTLISAFTPGPNNILALSTVGKYGFKKSTRLFTGMFFGFLCVMFLCGGFSIVLTDNLPGIIPTLRYIGAGYIVWLAVHIGYNKPGKSNDKDNQPSFLMGFLLQFLNVKIILYGLTALSGFVIPYYSSNVIIFGFAILLALIGMSGFLSWAACGSVFQRVFNKYSTALSLVMAALLLLCAVSLILT